MHAPSFSDNILFALPPVNAAVPSSLRMICYDECVFDVAHVWYSSLHEEGRRS